jgi:hypothetical protein
VDKSVWAKICLIRFLFKMFSNNNDLSPLFFNCAFEYVSRNDEGNRVGLKLNGTHQLLVYAYDVNLFEGNINAI